MIETGVETRTGQRLGREELLGLARAHDAVLVATGLQEARRLRLGLGGHESPVVQGIDFLDRVQTGKIRVGR